MRSSSFYACFCLALVYSSLSLSESAVTLEATLSWPMGTESDGINFNDSVSTPMISSATDQFFLAVQGTSSDDGVDNFCWLAVMDKADPDNHQQVWRAPCDQELQRLDKNESCFFGLASDGNLILSLGESFAGGRIAFSNGTSEADHAVLSDWGHILLQDAADATVWNSGDAPPPPSGCLGPFN